MKSNITIIQDYHHNKDRILFLDNMRGIAIIMVIGIHSHGYCLPLPKEQSIIIQFIVHTIAVPVFFLVDGFLFARTTSNMEKFNYFLFIKKSAIRLLLPWTIFTLIYLFLRYYLEYINFIDNKLIVGHSIKEVIINAYGSVYASQMYFLFSLFIVRLFSPVLRKLISAKSITVSITMFYAYLLIYSLSINHFSHLLHIDGGQEPILHALWGLQYFVLGIILFQIKTNFNIKHLLFICMSLLSVIAFFDNISDQIDTRTIQYFYLMSFFIFFTLWDRRFLVLDIIGKNTMGLLLLHQPVILKALSIVLNDIILHPLLNYLFILFGALIISTSIVILINSMPYLPIIFGDYKTAFANKELKLFNMSYRLTKS